MGTITERTVYECELREHSHTVRVRTPENAFAIAGFRPYGIHDPAGFRHGGDYVREFRISRNTDGTVRVRWRVAEWHRKLGAPEYDHFDADFPALFDALWPRLVAVKAQLKAAGKLK